MTTAHYAHSSPIPGQGPPQGWQPLADHLRGVANLARDFAKDACPRDVALADTAYAAGLLHDLGKYRAEFQLMLDCCSRGVSLSVPREMTYHKQAGAAKAACANSIELAFAIAGHHGGMPNKVDLQSMVKSAGGRDVAEAVWALAIQDCPGLAALVLAVSTSRDAQEADLRTRVLFSCLVDADWSDTALHGRAAAGLPTEPAAPRLNAREWLQRVLAFIATKASECKDAAVASARADVLEACLAAAARPPGVFSLTVPTGGGKTLSALAFGLAHAQRQGLRRVIYVAPYLSIIDQNVEVIRAALGLPEFAPDLFEHHSLAEPPGDESDDLTAREAAARRAENWDAPLVVTTSVQLFESLFANKPSRCRKLHNIARSVVILDECQTLPPGLVQPTCRMIRQLTETLGATVLLCTATQPAFDHDQLAEAERLRATEIIPPSLDLFRRLRRVSLMWPREKNECLDWPSVANRMLAAAGVLRGKSSPSCSNEPRKAFFIFPPACARRIVWRSYTGSISV
jgi:CRISPR-associated endonuclease Cas3-HD